MMFRVFFLLSCLIISGSSFAMQVKMSDEEAHAFLKQNPSSHPVVERAVELYNTITTQNWRTLTDLSRLLEERQSDLTPDFLDRVKAQIIKDKESFSRYYDEVKSVDPKVFAGIFPVQNICEILAQGYRNSQGIALQRPILDEILGSLSLEGIENLFSGVRAHTLHDHEITVAKNSFVYLLSMLDPKTYDRTYFQGQNMAYGIPMLPEPLESEIVKNLKESLHTSPLWHDNSVFAYNAGFQFGWPSAMLYPALLSQFNKGQQGYMAFDASSFVSFSLNTECRLSLPDVDNLWKHQKGIDVGDQKEYAIHLKSMTGLIPVDQPLPGDIIYNREDAVNFAVYLKVGETEGTYYGLTDRKAGDGKTWEGPGIGILVFKNPQILRKNP